MASWLVIAGVSPLLGAGRGRSLYTTVHNGKGTERELGTDGAPMGRCPRLSWDYVLGRMENYGGRRARGASSFRAAP